MYHLNSSARMSSCAPYSTAEYEDLSRFYAVRRELQATPLRSLPCFARVLGVGALYVKDESSRFGLNAFKILGVRYAVDRLQRQGSIAPDAVLACASTGNHGRAVARVARELGLAARVYMGHHASAAARRAIASEGAEVVIIDGSYEDAVHRMADEAGSHGWTIVSDTSWPGYGDIARLITLGYTRLVHEVHQQLADTPHVVFAQGGVGGLVSAVAAGLQHEWPRDRPRLVACEPTAAACLLASAKAGRLATLDGPIDTIMAGLRCAEPSPAAWPVVRELVDAFVAVDDARTMAAMRRLARPIEADPPIEAGPSGACGLAALVAVMTDESMRAARDALELGSPSRVVVINTEGATDPDVYARIMNES